MVGHQEEQLVQLHRDTISTSWGFRLQGGQETNTPLTVQRVFVGGVSDGKLQRGDIIAAIGGHNARGMYHSQAEEIIKGAGRDISFKVLRGGSGAVRSPGQNDYYSQQVPWQASAPSWRTPGVEEDFEQQRSVGDLRRQFTPPAPSSAGRIQTRPQPGTPSYVPKRPLITKRPNQFEALNEPGWVPGTARPGQQGPPKASRYVPQSPPVNIHQPRQQHAYPVHAAPLQPIHHEEPEPPAWLGTLRSAGGPRLWEIQEGETLVGGGARAPAPVRREQAGQPVYSSTAPVASGPVFQPHQPRVQSARYGPSGNAPTYDQYNAAGVDSETARIAHLQYNTPIGLYSKDSAREALEGQTRGKAGYGTMEITGTGYTGPGTKIKSFDPAHSDVYRLVLEEDEVRKHGGVVYGTNAPRGRPGGAPKAPSAGAPAAAHYSNPAPAPQHAAAGDQEQHSSRFYQLVHENDDQAEQYSNIHPEQYRHQQPAVAGLRDVEGRFDDMGISDF